MIVRLKSLLFVLVLGGLLAGLLAGCGASGESASDSAAAAPAAENDAAFRDASGAASGADTSAVKPEDAEADPTAAVTRLVRTAEVTVEVKDVAAAARAVRTTAVTFGGIVSTEDTRFPTDEGEDGDDVAENAPAENDQSVLTLRVPEPRMDDALTKIATVGTEINRTTTSEDVTATIADLDSRVATQTKSVARVRDLLARADSLQDVVLLESELSKREADLESVQARQRALSDKAALATITVTLLTLGAEEEVDEAGFLAGLDQGWTTLEKSTTVVLTVIGALLPVAVVLAIIGYPAYRLRRRWLAHRPPAPPAGPNRPWGQGPWGNGPGSGPGSDPSSTAGPTSPASDPASSPKVPAP